MVILGTISQRKITMNNDDQPEAAKDTIEKSRVIKTIAEGEVAENMKTTKNMEKKKIQKNMKNMKQMNILDKTLR